MLCGSYNYRRCTGVHDCVSEAWESAKDLKHRRRKRGEGGGSGGACPHKLQVVGALPPQPEPSSMICCISPGQWFTTWNSWTIERSYKVCSTYLTACSFSLNLSRYSQETLDWAQGIAPRVQKWAWFGGNVGVVKTFCTLRTQLYYSAPTTCSIFLRLCKVYD